MQPPRSPEFGNIEAASQRYLELVERDDYSLGFKAEVNPDTLETNLTPESAQAATDYFADPSLANDWEVLADEIDTNSIEGRGLWSVVTRHITVMQLTKARLRGDLDQVQELEQSLRGELYSDQMFTDAVHDTLAHLATFNAAEYPYTYGVAQRVGPMLEDIVGNRKRDPNATTRLTPRAKTDIGRWVEGHMGHILDEIDPDKTYGPAEIADILQRTITLLPASFQGTRWRAVVDKEMTIASIRTSSAEDLVSVAGILPPSSGTKVKKYDIHEILGHAKRSASGRKNNSPLATHGTANNFYFEESLCVLVEKTPFPDTEYGLPGVVSYLQTGLAVGALGTDFDRRQILSLISNVMHAVSAKVYGRDLTPKEQEERTYTATTALADIFPGIPVGAKGIARLTSLRYYFGQRKVAPLLNKISELGIVNEGMSWILSGKFNPYYQDDRTLVNRYSPMPEALAPFFAEQ